MATLQALRDTIEAGEAVELTYREQMDRGFEMVKKEHGKYLWVCDNIARLTFDTWEDLCAEIEEEDVWQVMSDVIADLLADDEMESQERILASGRLCFYCIR